MISKRRRKRFCKQGKIGNLSFREGKNDFLCPVFSLKNRFLNHAQVAFSVGKRNKMSIQEVRKLHCREYGTRESSISRHCPSPIFGCVEGRK
jgi:hypothetical protein